MNRPVRYALLLALGIASAGCGKRPSVDDNRSLAQAPPKPSAPKCSLQHPLACRSSSILMNSPDFERAVRIFEGRKHYGKVPLHTSPDDVLYLSGEGEIKVIDNDLILLNSCVAHDCGDNGAAIVKDGKVLAVGIQYYSLPYHRRDSDLYIFVERRTPESNKWIDILRRWGKKGEKVRVYEIARLPNDPHIVRFP